ncbi:hypothetical protein FKP32DRAFT_1775001 [Trametes sanguinea]|nr:hypothetical protein FKP32DRAFT_1775001 [Trametes sanguinea]
MTAVSAFRVILQQSPSDRHSPVAPAGDLSNVPRIFIRCAPSNRPPSLPPKRVELLCSRCYCVVL